MLSVRRLGRARRARDRSHALRCAALTPSHNRAGYCETMRGPSKVNPVLAGCAAGAVVGVRSGKISHSLLGCGLFGGGQFLAQLGLHSDE